MRKILGAAGLAALALALTACASSSTSSSTPATATAAPAAAGSSAAAAASRRGSWAPSWPPVAAPAAAGSGVTGTLATITRSDGTTQATYDGHPLYTYVGDTAAGQAKGNGLNLSGGLWYEMTVSGAKPAVHASSTSTSGGGYGY